MLSASTHRPRGLGNVHISSDIITASKACTPSNSEPSASRAGMASTTRYKFNDISTRPTLVLLNVQTMKTLCTRMPRKKPPEKKTYLDRHKRLEIPLRGGIAHRIQYLGPVPILHERHRRRTVDGVVCAPCGRRARGAERQEPRAPAAAVLVLEGRRRVACEEPDWWFCWVWWAWVFPPGCVDGGGEGGGGVSWCQVAARSSSPCGESALEKEEEGEEGCCCCGLRGHLFFGRIEGGL